MRSELSAINDRLKEGVGLVIVSGPPGSGKTHLLSECAKSCGLEVEDAAFLPLDLGKIDGNLVLDNVHPNDLPHLRSREWSGISVVVSTCVSGSDHVLMPVWEVEAEFVELSGVLERGGSYRACFRRFKRSRTSHQRSRFKNGANVLASPS